MRLEQIIREKIIAESADMDSRLQQLVRAGLMPQSTLPILRKSIAKVQNGMALQGPERDVMATFINSMMYIVLGDDAIFSRARAGARGYAAEEIELEEGQKPYVSASPGGIGRSAEANVLNSKGKTSMTFTKKEHGPDYMKKANAHLKKHYNKLMGEEIEELDELSNDTLRSYRMKAKSIADHGGKMRTKGRELAGRKSYGGRMAGVEKAKVMATKEDIDAVKQMNESYKTEFDTALTKYGIKSPSELDESKRKEFFNYVDQQFKKGDN
jgi:hypothetical protein